MQKEFGRTLPFLRGTGRALKEMSVFFAHNRFMNGYSSLQHSYTSSQFWLKLNLGLCLDFFSVFPANVSSLHVPFFSLLLFLGIGFLWFLASHRIALLFRISLSSTEFFNLS